MKNLLFIAFFGAIIYFGFMKTSFEKEFLFDGEVYSHSKRQMVVLWLIIIIPLTAKHQISIKITF